LIISPSLLAADFSQLEQEIKRIEPHAEWLHLDIMDGHFVPNISFGVPVVRSLRKVTDLFFDVHLMISHPLTYIDPFVDAGADILCFHIECQDDVSAVIEKIHSRNKLAGLAISPDTDIHALIPYLEQVEMVLVMGVYPGFGGQKFLPQTCSRLREVKGLLMRLPEEKRKIYLQVDGGVDQHTAHLVKDAGANVLVSGSYVFGSANPAQAIYQLRYN
jgi:ribulose-phosphate 3-epimerase